MRRVWRATPLDKRPDESPSAHQPPTLPRHHPIEPRGRLWIALRIQELYDVTATPRLAMNRVPVLLHILAPNMRPVQITQDLANFWHEHYPKLKQELQRKYPKHEWR